MRIAEKYLIDIIAHEGTLASGPVLPLGILRLALDLREAREKIAQLEDALQLRQAQKPKSTKRTLALVTEEVVTGRFGDPRGEYEEHVEVRETGKKVDFRA